MPDVVPPAPEAASLGKYVDMPVNYSSGLPQISLPLFNATNRDVTVPVSLSYHAGGIRVEEIASRVGLGWNLQAGGSITRSVRGIADDGPNGWLSPETTVSDFKTTPGGVTGENNKNVLMEEALSGGNDYEPDIFNFSYPGGGGKFIFDENGNVTTIPGSEHKITYTMGGGNLAGISSFVITDPNGYKYFFGQYGSAVARDVTANTQSFTDSEPQEDGIALPSEQVRNNYSTWYLLRIDSPVSDAGISLHYTSFENVIAINRGGQTQMSNHSHAWGDDICEPTTGFRTTYSRSVNTELALSQIDFGLGKILFHYTSSFRTDLPGSRALDKVVLIDKNLKELRTFDLIHDYWTSDDHDSYVPILNAPKEHFTKRLFLEKVVETGEDNSDPKEYIFDYEDDEDMPNRFSYEQDIWGFYNGAGNNENLLPTRYDPGLIFPTPTDQSVFVDEGADRRSNLAKGKVYSIKSITYPTGGSAHFDFEANGVFRDRRDLHLANTYFETEDDHLATYHYNPSVNSSEIEFTVDESHLDGALRFTYDVTGCNVQEGPNGMVECGIAVNLVGVSDPGYFRQLSLNDNYNFRVAPGTYKLQVEVISPADVTYAHAIITGFKNASPYADRQEFSVGGLRVYRTTMDDTFGNKIIREYSYISNENDIKKGVYASSGVLGAQKWSFYEKGVRYCPQTDFAIADQETSYSTIPASGTGTGHVTYTKVLETQLPDNGEVLPPHSTLSFARGFTVYDYEFAPDQPQSGTEVFPYAPYKEFGWLRGGIKKQSHFGKEGAIFRQISSQETKREHAKNAGDPFYKEIEAIKIDKRGSLPVFSLYKVVAGASHIKQRITRNFQINGSIEEITDFEYNQHFLRSDKTTVTHSDGQKTITSVKYTDDSFGDELSSVEKSALSDMVQANMLVPVLTETFRNDETNPVGKSLTVFQGLNAGFLPVAARFWNEDLNDYEQRLTYSYTDEGNYKHLIKDGGEQVAYIWGYDNSRATARVTNVSAFSDVAYSSFESEDKGNWEYEGSSDTGPDLPSGQRFYDLTAGAISKSGLNTGRQYILSFWEKGDGAVTVSNSTENNSAETANKFGWHYHELLVTNTETLTISGTNEIDELRLYPLGAQMTTYTYKLLRGVTSVGSPNNSFTHYVYDKQGRLHFTKDQDGNILKLVEYKYKESIND